jgi:hypothetical protein
MAKKPAHALAATGGCQGAACPAKRARGHAAGAGRALATGFRRRSSRRYDPAMPDPRRNRRLPKPDRQRALALLASCRDGCTEAILTAHGFSIAQMVELVQAGLATPTADRIVAGGRTMEVARVRITDAGRRALAG